MDDICSAAVRGDINGVRRALDNGTDINAPDEPEGTTALHLASQEGHVEIVRLLLARGADMEVENGTARQHSMKRLSTTSRRWRSF